MKKKVDFVFKIVAIGDGRVGKTSLIKMFTENSFKKEYIKTIGAQFSSYHNEVDGKKIKLLFWDIAGQDEFHFLRPSFFKNSKAAIIICSLEDNKMGKESIEHIINWYNDVTHYCGNIPIVLFANKADLVNQDNLDELKFQKIVQDQDFLDYYITSAKTGQGVKKAFNAIIENLYYRNKELSLEL